MPWQTRGLIITPTGYVTSVHTGTEDDRIIIHGRTQKIVEEIQRLLMQVLVDNMSMFVVYGVPHHRKFFYLALHLTRFVF